MVKNDALTLEDECGLNNLKLWPLVIDGLKVNAVLMYLNLDYYVEVGMPLSYPHAIIISPRLLQYCSEGRFNTVSRLSYVCSVLKVIYQYGSSSLHFLYFLLINDGLRSPDNVPVFYYRPYIGFVQINKHSFIKMLKCFMNYGWLS